MRTGEPEIIVKKDKLDRALPSEYTKTEGSFIVINTGKVYSEIDKEQVIAAIESGIEFGEVNRKKKFGQIYHVDVHFSLQFPIKKPKKKE